MVHSRRTLLGRNLVPLSADQAAGLLIGRTVGARFGPIVELIGGLGLIGIGTGILLEHTGIIG
jgi:putative Mn2+ efflux pump MntP